MIASHYAEAVPRVLSREETLRGERSDYSEAIRVLAPGEPFDMLENSIGWAWGYAGADRRVGYVRSDALSAAG